MKVTSTPPPESGKGATAGSSLGQLLDGLRLQPGGQALAQVIARLEDTGNGNSRLLLELAGRQVTVDAEMDLKPGQWIKVERAANQLRLMTTLTTPADSTTQLQGQVAGALAQRLPFQHRLDTGLLQLMRALQATGSNGSLTGTSTQTAAPLPPTAQTAIGKLLQQLPPQQALAQLGGKSGDAAMVKRLLAGSGLFTEARLAQASQTGGTPPAGDLKLALMELVADLAGSRDPRQLTALLRDVKPSVSDDLVQAPLQFPGAPAPVNSNHGFIPLADDKPLDTGQMLKLLAGMLNRIAVNQLHSQSLTTQNTPDGPLHHTWLLEIPWLNPQGEPRSAQLRLERHPEDGGNANEKRRQRTIQWRLNLALDLDHLGPVFFEVALHNRKLETSIWAERETTVRLLEQQSDGLRQRLSDLDLEVARLECLRGHPQRRRTQLEQRLVDIRA